MLDKTAKKQLDKSMSDKVYAWMNEQYVLGAEILGLSTNTSNAKPARSANPVKRLKLRLSKMESFGVFLGMGYSQMILSHPYTKMAVK